MRRRERLKHKQPTESMVLIHDGLCPREPYPGTEPRDLARILQKFTELFDLVDLCECGSPIWAAIVPRHRVHELMYAVEHDLDGMTSVQGKV